MRISPAEQKKWADAAKSNRVTAAQISRRLENNSATEMDNALNILKLPRQRSANQKLRVLSNFLSEGRGIEQIVKVLSMDSFKKLYSIQDSQIYPSS